MCLNNFYMYQAGNTVLSPELKIAEVIFDNPRIITLLEHFNIFVPFQEKTIKEICTENNLDLELFLTFANLYNGKSYKLQFRVSFEVINSIIKFLKNSHIYYINEKCREIKSNIVQMTSRNHEMVLVEKFFNEYYNEIIQHLNYEDDVAFPYMLSLYEHIAQKKQFAAPKTYSVSEYKEHHNDIEEKLNDLKSLLVKYLPFKNDQQERRKLYFNLHELEFDLNVHSRIEDMVLIPLVEQMEQQLKSAGE